MRKLSIAMAFLLSCVGHFGGATGTLHAQPSAPTPVNMVFEGLVAYEPVTAGTAGDGLWALMVAADKPDPAAHQPPCSNGQEVHTYPVHKPGIFVEGGQVTVSVDGGPAQPLPARFLAIENEDIRVSVEGGSPYLSSPASLARLVDDLELALMSSAAANGRLTVDRARFLAADAGTVAAEPALAARILIDSGVVAARANVCAKNSNEVVFFGFMKIGDEPASACKPKFGVELAEDLLVTHPRAGTVTITLTHGPVNSRRVRTLTVKSDGTAPKVTIYFRNVMTALLGQPGDACIDGDHHAVYQWFYNLTANPSQGCDWIPCRVPGSGLAGGGKCPTPGRGA